MPHLLYIKNMVCLRCRLAVSDLLQAQGLEALSVELGEVLLSQSPSETQMDALALGLQNLGFELLHKPKDQTVERIKNLLIDLVQNHDAQLPNKLSDYLSKQLLRDYSILSKLFSEQEQTTIERYFILQKLEKVKELLAYEQMSLADIAQKLHYANAAHLSRQFKQVIGLNPSQFRQLGPKRQGLDQVLSPSPSPQNED